MWGALLAATSTGWLHHLTTARRDGRLVGHGTRGGQAMIATLRRRLVAVPARLIGHARGLSCAYHPATTCSPRSSPASARCHTCLTWSSLVENRAQPASEPAHPRRHSGHQPAPNPIHDPTNINSTTTRSAQRLLADSGLSDVSRPTDRAGRALLHRYRAGGPERSPVTADALLHLTAAELLAVLLARGIVRRRGDRRRHAAGGALCGDRRRSRSRPFRSRGRIVCGPAFRSWDAILDKRIDMPEACVAAEPILLIATAMRRIGNVCAGHEREQDSRWRQASSRISGRLCLPPSGTRSARPVA